MAWQSVSDISSGRRLPFTQAKSSKRLLISVIQQNYWLRLRLKSIVGVKFDYKLIKLCVSVVKSNGLIDLQWGFSSRLLDPSRFTLIIPLCNCLFSSQDFSSLLKLISLLFSCFVSCHLSFAIFSLDLFELLHNRNRIEIEWKYFVAYQINAESLTKTMIKGS